MLAAIIQARMGSTRLPGKTFAEVGGKPMLGRLLERVGASRYVKDCILATTNESGDDVLAEFALRRGLKLFRGSEADVLDRIYEAARRYDVRTIVRVTPDCPLLDPQVMDQVIEVYRSGRYDYVSNTLGRRFPDGLDVEVFSFEALEWSWRQAKLPSEREHVTLHIRTCGRFRIGNVDAPADFSRLKWSVDTADDLTFVRTVYARLGQNGTTFYLKDVLDLLQREPQLGGAHSHRVVNEGYYRSLAEDPPIPVKARSLDRSGLLGGMARELIPGAAQTFSKGPTQFVQGVSPTFLVRADGCRVWDADGNDYLDCAMALGAVILGYRDPEVNEAVRRQTWDGVSFSLPHPLELELGHLLREIIPCAEMIRFGKNGSDATSGAVRLARAYTGRDLVACCGYHGWQDWYIGTTTRCRGVPQKVRDLTKTFEYNNLSSLEGIFSQYPGQVAAVILEPVGVIAPQDNFLQRIRDLTQREGALLIFDEVLTGFRLDLGGAQGYFGVTPDLACFGKAMANGFPLSALVGRRQIMSLLEEVFYSFTFGGEAVSLAAALATIQKIRRENVIGHLWSQGLKLKDGFNQLAHHYGLESAASCVGFPPRTVVEFKGRDSEESLILKSFFQQECIKRGVLFTGSHLPSYCHGEAATDQILRVYRTVLEILAQAIREDSVVRRLEGQPLQPVLRQA